MDKVPNWLRWILFIPASFTAFVIIRLINRLTFLFLFDPYSFLFKVLNLAVEGTLATAALLITAYYIAPHNKKTVVIASSGVVSAIYLVGITISLTSNVPVPIWEITLVGLLTIITCIVTSIQVSKYESSTGVK
ncbi:hypothetical protein [Sporomusa aerivorans]|uniref:hypothetical protein n=1 Tax=Sporomusa aerivorans TaxID=204936 RepID=UPI00352A9A1D